MLWLQENKRELMRLDRAINLPPEGTLEWTQAGQDHDIILPSAANDLPEAPEAPSCCCWLLWQGVTLLPTAADTTGQWSWSLV